MCLRGFQDCSFRSATFRHSICATAFQAARYFPVARSHNSSFPHKTSPAQLCPLSDYIFVGLTTDKNKINVNDNRGVLISFPFTEGANVLEEERSVTAVIGSA